MGKGAISFEAFLDAYDDFYYRYALDGHESDAEERLLLDEQAEAIEFHRVVQEDILNLVGRTGKEQTQQQLAALCKSQRAGEVFRQFSE